MPPRISNFLCLEALKATLPSCSARQTLPSTRLFSATASQAKKGARHGQRHRYRDPYLVAQARARKAANLSKQEALRLNRAQALGDPVRGIETDFVRSFDNAGGQANSEAVSEEKGEEGKPELNYSLDPADISEQLGKSKRLITPKVLTLQNSLHMRPMDMTEREWYTEIQAKNERSSKWSEAAHDNVEEVIKRLGNLENGNSKDRHRVNIERCIDTFGRHNTDGYMEPRPARPPLGPGGLPLTEQAVDVAATRKARSGPDTGSSEVQIAILTARIRKLADHLERVGNHDKMNKRNLRLLVHRRQKLLQYLRRKEREGPRWQKCINTLGLTEGTWRGEITL